MTELVRDQELLFDVTIVNRIVRISAHEDSSLFGNSLRRLIGKQVVFNHVKTNSDFPKPVFK